MEKTAGTFDITEDMEAILRVSPSYPRNMTKQILKIFEVAEKELGKNKLTVNEITAAYYNLFSSKKLAPVRDKKAITLKLFLMKGGKKNNGILERVGNGRIGIYKIREPHRTEEK